MITTPLYKLVDGYKFPTVFNDDHIRAGLNYATKAGQLFVTTYPKCGTNWTVEIVNLLRNNGDPPPPGPPNFLEMMGPDHVDKSGQVIFTHIPFGAKSWHPQSKHIIVLRNPKDACVSFYYHYQNIHNELTDDVSCNDFLKHWIKGMYCVCKL